MTPPPSSRLPAADALRLATETSAAFQVAVQQADAKIAMILVVHPGTSLVVLTQLGGLPTGLRSLGVASVLAAVGAVAFGAGFVVSGAAIFNALRPRLTPPESRNRFAFPAVAEGDCPTILEATPEELAKEAWTLAVLLAQVAVAKNRQLHKAIRWLLPLVAGAAMFTLGVHLA